MAATADDSQGAGC